MAQILKAFILSGGLARRAGGANKSFLKIDGRPILELQLERLRPIFSRNITVVTDRPADYVPWGLECISDLPDAAFDSPPVDQPVAAQFAPEPGKGSAMPLAPADRSPLRGLATSLRHTRDAWCFLLASDMPWPDPDLIRAQWDLLRRSVSPEPPLGLCLRWKGRIQPFHAVYSGALAPSAAEALTTPDRSLRGWIERNQRIIILEAEEIGISAETLERCFTNFNEAP